MFRFNILNANAQPRSRGLHSKILETPTTTIYFQGGYYLLEIIILGFLQV